MEIPFVTPVDITNREPLFERLSRLASTATALFGMMTPQHMIEHLTVLIRAANENEPLTLMYAQEKADKIKAVVIYSPQEMPIGFKAPILPKEELVPLQHPDLKTAMEVLKKELSNFDAYFLANPTNTPVNPTMGPLSHQEWMIFQNKHFTHHFRQFGL